MNNEELKREVILAVKQWCEEHGLCHIANDIYGRCINDMFVRIIIFRYDVSFRVGKSAHILLKDKPVEDFLRVCTAEIVRAVLDGRDEQ